MQYRGLMTSRLTPARALREVAATEDGLYGVLLQHGSMELGFYQPKLVDEQQPHDQDELYFVHCGSGIFVRGDERIPFQQGDALFVAAGIEHRFVDFSDDFAAWVVFWGPMGGEGMGGAGKGGE